MSKVSCVRRTGKARLLLAINGQSYTIRRIPAPAGWSRLWLLRKITPPGEPRQFYSVGRQVQPEVALECSCPDHQWRGARCKHIAALVAVGLVSGRAGKGGGR